MAKTRKLAPPILTATSGLSVPYSILGTVTSFTSSTNGFDYQAAITSLAEAGQQMGANAVIEIRINERSAVRQGCLNSETMVGEVRAYGTAVRY